MKNTSQQNPFFDKNTFVAIVLSFAVFFLWQLYMSKKYPKQNEQQTAVESVMPKPKVEEASVPGAPSPSNPEKPTAVLTVSDSTPIRDYTFDTPQMQIVLSSRGLGFKKIQLKQLLQRSGAPIAYQETDNQPLGETRLAGEPIVFNVEEKSPGEFIGTATKNGVQIIKTVKINPENFTAQFAVSVNSQESKNLRFEHLLFDELRPVHKGFLLPAYETQEFFTVTDKERTRTVLSPDESKSEIQGGVKLASLSSQYFTLAFLNQSDVFPQTKNYADSARHQASIEWDYQSVGPTNEIKAQTLFFFGPKNLDLLKSVDPLLPDVIDLGFFSVIGKPLLSVLKFIHQFVKNWGIAIILLTLMLKLILLPMNLYSFKAMKKMQKVQPQLQAIKEKYKNDTQRMNQETMQLMRSEGANPVGGCLPMLMQIPIFFALYQVLGKSIELYQSPFALWIHDLSIKDPYYVLPVLVGAMFFIQQKITPTSPTVDPVQAKILLYMPVLFSFFMLSVPSGLTLYMFVNSLFSIVQQFIFTRQTTTA